MCVQGLTNGLPVLSCGSGSDVRVVGVVEARPILAGVRGKVLARAAGLSVTECVRYGLN